jgi:hypothetical protein
LVSVNCFQPALRQYCPSGGPVDWRLEDETFWSSQGAAVARRNLWISIPALLLAFAVWMVWSAVVVNLPRVGFAYGADLLFWPAAPPGLSGATFASSTASWCRSSAGAAGPRSRRHPR